MNSSEEFREIETDLIEPNDVQPRTRFDEQQLEELTLSIKENGIVQPVLVRKLGERRFQIVAGERRWRAAQRAGLSRLPAIIRDVPDNKMLELALIENIQRQELNPIEEAYAYKRLIDTLGLTQEIVAQRVGRDRTFVTNHLRLLRLPEDIQQLVEENKLSMGHARTLLGIDDPERQRSLAKNIIDNGLSVRKTELMIRKVIDNPSQERTHTKPQEIDANTRLAEVKLRRRLTTQIKIVPNSQGEGGKIEIHYYNSADLQRLFELINGNADKE